MNTSATCPCCRQPLPPDAPDAPGGLCPKCLMQAGLPTGVDIGPDSRDGAGHPPFVAPSAEDLAPYFPQLEILELLGRGGMGAVYKARQKQLDRFVAVKILPPGIGDDPAFAERFTREAKALAKLNHPNIVTLYEFGQTDGLFYFIMEFVDGLNLKQLLEVGRIAPREALAIVPQICDALQYAHDDAIVHRDIKPENILLDRRGRVKVADFGIAALIGAGAENIGTPPYMAPEQSGASSEVDSRADIYALGVVLYEMLTGERPNKNLVAPSKKVQIDVRLDEIVLRALEKTPELRYQTAGEFRTVVETMAAAPPSPLPNPADELATRACESLYATPEHLATIWGSMKLHEGMATLALYSDRFVIGRGWQTATIPFHALRKLNVVMYPRCLSMSGLHSILVEYEEAGIPQRIILTPRKGFGIFSSTSKTNQSVAEWFLAIREAVTLASGQPPAGSATPELYQGLSSEGMVWAKLAWVFNGMMGLGFLVFLILEGSSILGNPLVFARYLPMFVFGMAFVFFMVRSQRKQWQRDNPLPTVGESPDLAADLMPVTKSSLSRTAILGAFFAILCMSAMILQIKAFGIAATAVVTTLLGWIAVSKIRRSAGKLHGMWLAVFDGLLFPLLAVDGAVILPIMRFFQQANGNGMIPFWAMLLIGLVMIALITINVLLIRRVWRAVNSNNSTAPQQAGTTEKPTRFSRKTILVAANVCMVLSFAVLFTKQWNERKREGVWVPARISDTITRQYGDAQVRVVDVSQTGQVVLVSIVCEMFRPDHELRMQYGGPVLSYPNDLASSVKTKVKDLDCLIVPRAKIVDDNIGEVLAGTNVLSEQTMFRIGFVLPDAQTAAQVVKAVQEVHLGKPRGMGEGGGVLLLFSLRRDFGKDAAGKPVVEALDASLWLRPKSNATAAHKSAAAPELSFGPVVERVVMAFEENPSRACLDFGSGEFRSPPEPSALAFSNLKAPGDERYDWFKSSGVDLIGSRSVDGSVSFKFMGQPPAYHVGPATFDSATASEVIQTLQLSPWLEGTKPNMPDIRIQIINPDEGVSRKAHYIAFRTQDGDVGIMQVLGTSQNPRGLKIRYKLVRFAEAKVKTNRDQIAVEDLALQMIVAIREKDNDTLQSLATDRIKGWRAALPQFATELREHFRQSTGNDAFGLRASESLVDGDLAAVRCTGPAELKGKCLVLFFVKTDDGWRNHSLRNSLENAPLAGQLADFKK